jgi:hypothetical protein
MATAPQIPLDIRELLHDCILALFWPKAKILEFLESAGCPEALSSKIGSKQGDLSRHQMVVEAFSLLTARPDRGFSIFQIMIDRLMTWSYFDPYWFETVPKLNRADADASLERLRRAVNQRNSATASRRQSQANSMKEQARSNDLTALTSAFQKLFGSGMTAQARGRLFERFLQELFNRQSIKMGDPFRINGEQIDGTFKFEGENYIVEAKWQDPSTSTGDLYKFAYKVDGKMHGRGVFVSVNGFSRESISSVVHGKHIQTILIDGEDLSMVLEGRVTLEKMLDYKIRAAQTRGEVYVCALREASKL